MRDRAAPPHPGIYRVPPPPLGDECLSKQSLDDCNIRNYQRIGKYYNFRLIITSSTYHKNLIQKYFIIRLQEVKQSVA